MASHLRQLFFRLSSAQKGEAFQGTIPQQLGEAALDVAEIPVSITGYAGGIGAGLAEHIGDVAIAAPYTALTDTPTPSGMAGMRQLWTGEVGRLKEARDKYDQAFRVPIIELLVQSGVPQEEIDHLLQLDNAWLRKAKPRAPNEYRGLLSDGKFAHDFDIYNSPLFSRVNDILVGGGSSLKVPLILPPGLMVSLHWRDCIHFVASTSMGHRIVCSSRSRLLTSRSSRFQWMILVSLLLSAMTGMRLETVRSICFLT